MRTKLITLFIVIALFLLIMVASAPASAEAHSRPAPFIVVQPGEGVEFYDASDGTEPPPHVVILNKDGSVFRVVGNRPPN